MITYLKVRNLAIVEELAIEPGPGLNVLTGETGAGKSLLIDSLEFLRGARGSTEMIRSGSDRMTAEAVFHLLATLRAQLDELGVECEGGDGPLELIVRREIAAALIGFANDSLPLATNVTFTAGGCGACGPACTFVFWNTPRQLSSKRSFSRAAGSSFSPRGTATSIASSTFCATLVAASLASVPACFASCLEHATAKARIAASTTVCLFMRLIHSEGCAEVHF